MEKLSLVGRTKIRELLNNYSDYTLYIRKGFAFNGAEEFLEDRQPKPTRYTVGFNKYVIKNQTFEERMQNMYKFYMVYDVDIDHENKELHINAY